MDNFQVEDDTAVVDVDYDIDDEIAVPRTPTNRRRKSSYIGLIPLKGVMDLPVGTELYGPKGQHGYIAGHSSEGLVIFDLKGDVVGNSRIYHTVEARPASFDGWRTSGGATL